MADFEEEDTMREKSSGGFLLGMVVGAAVGAGLALLFAPGSGQDTRKRLVRRLRRAQRDVEPMVDEARRRGRQLAKRGGKLRRRLEDAAEEARDRLADVI
jgi:gas vesicle protein